MFRWDLWVRGAFASGFVSTISIAPALVTDGVSKLELWALLAGFLGGVALFCKSHPPNYHEHDDIK